MKSKEIVESTTAAGSIASVAMPIGGMQKRAGSLFKGKKTKKKFYEGKVKELMFDLGNPPKGLSDAEFKEKYGKTKEEVRKLLKEEEIIETDLILMPGQLKGKDKSFIPHKEDRRDHEVEMARSDLYAAAKDAQRIYKMLQGRTEDEGLMGWQQSYITLAADYLNSVADSLEHHNATEGAGVIAGGMSNFQENTQRVDSLVTDALKIMKGSDLEDAVEALKTVLGDREFNSRRGFYNFYIKQIVDMYGKKGVAEGDGDPDIKPGMKVSQGTVVKVNGNTVIVKASNGDLMSMNIHDIDHSVAEGSLEEIDRRGFLKGLGAAGLSGAAATASAAPFKHDKTNDEMDDKAPVLRTATVKSNDGTGSLYIQYGGKTGNGVFIDITNGLIDPRDQDSIRIKFHDQPVMSVGILVDKTKFKSAQLGNSSDIAGISTEQLAKKILKHAGELKIELSLYGKGKYIYKFTIEQDSITKSIKEQKCPSCGGELVSEELMNEKKDACYYKVKSRYKVWPSAYASGALVKCRKVGAKNWGNKSKK